MSEPNIEIDLAIAGSDSTIKAHAYTLSFWGQSSFEILVDSRDIDSITESIIDHSYDFPLEFALLPLLARPGQRVLDLGAHIGTFSLLAAKLGYEVASVEASPRNYTLLQESARRNHFDNLVVLPVAVSNRSETIEFIQAGPYGLVATPLLNDPVISVPAMSVDEMVTQLGWDRMTMIKMDVEGSEVKAVAGMKGVLGRADAPTILFESNGHTLHYFGETPNTLMAALEACGYQCYLVKPGRLIPLAPTELLFLCTVDCLATKAPPTTLQGWQLRGPLTREEQISHILITVSEQHPHPRSYIARTLQYADLDLLADSRVSAAMEKLAQESDPEVRASAAWFMTSDFQSALSEKKQQIARSESYVVRAKRVLNRWRNKAGFR